MIEDISDRTSSSYTFMGRKWPSGISMADKYCVPIKSLPERLWRADYYDPKNPNHPLKVGISAHDTTSAFPDTEEKLEAKILQLLSDQQKGPISRLSVNPKAKVDSSHSGTLQGQRRMR
jgi:hypothetical protein